MNDNVVQEILERIVRIETKIDGYNNLREKLDTAITDNKTQDERIITLTREVKEIKDNTKWLWRSIAGALILGFIAAYVKFN